MKSKSYFILTLLLLLSVQLNAGWQRPVTNYTRHTYKAGNQNWMLQQHDNGWMYVANSNGLLEFDGASWNLYPIRNAKARAMRIGNDGRIYIGGIGWFGYFTPNRLGGLDYTCLSDNLPPNSIVGVIWNILQDKERIYFQSDRSLFYWENNKLEYLEYPGEIYTSAILYNKFYIGAAEGVLVMDGKKFSLVPGSEMLGRVSGLLPYSGKILIATRYNGLFIYDGETVQKFNSVADSFMQHNRVFCAALNQSLLALGSVQDGVCLLDLEKDEMNVISINSGLQNKTVLSMSFDALNNLWLGLDNGIDCVHLSSPVSSLYGNKPVIGSGYSSIVYQGKLYLASNQGLYTTLPSTELNKEIPMTFVPGTGGQMWSFLNYDGKLFCASDNGVFVIDGDKMEHLDGIKGVRSLVPLNGRPDVLIAGTYGKYSGLHLLKKVAGRWQPAFRLKNFTYAAKSLMAESSGNALWVTNKDRGVCRLILSDDLQEVVSLKKYNHSAFPSGYDIFLTQVNSETVAVSHYGLWRYNQATDSLEEYHELENMLDGKAAYSYLTMDMAHNIWYVSGEALKLLRYDAVKNTYSKLPHDTFLKGSLIENYEHVNVYDGQATGLHEGKYVFSVKLMTDKDQELVMTSFSFEILPPWYRTWWSYLIYAVAVGLLLYYIAYRIAVSRKHLLMQKELELYRQKQEFKKESELKDQKIDSLKEENLQAELSHKSEELIRTTLNIVRKNEMLMGIKKEVLGISHSISEENLVSLRRKTLRLLGQIETNIEHDDDLQAFQSTFDSVYHDFFRKLEEAYPELNNKDKLLCAYIKMNLLSKEIAPLLNISLRGVEISRYRLRKKLGLEEGENLAEFLQRFNK